MNTITTNSVSDAISAHRGAVLADEANFTDDGQPIDEAAANASQVVEIEAFRELVRVPCLSLDDVMEKSSYLLNGNVGQRTPMVECLTEPIYADADLTAALLTSFLACTGA